MIGIMKEKIYDNSNIAESYAGITTPLTFSFARYVYQEVYRHFSRVIGASNKMIQENKHIFEHMIEFIGYRIYYNLNSWYTMLAFFPGERKYISGERRRWPKV
jgi:pyruvate,water dikinase